MVGGFKVAIGKGCGKGRQNKSETAKATVESRALHPKVQAEFRLVYMKSLIKNQ